MKLYKKQASIKKYHGVEYKHIQSLRLLYILIGGAIAGTIGLIIFFIYSNVYRTLEDANTIIILRSDLGVETIDFRRLEAVKKTWKTRYQAERPTIHRDPFALPSVQTQKPSATETSTPL